ncbi:hypothetical protein lerEdw1_011446 [Lerista edwardsae]|nr:hypothetical protein lerEdw1_011446 [Lerista edwardsae]
MYGCELREDGTSKGYLKFGYDGRDFLTFDKETLTWRAAVVPAQRTKREWDAESGNNEYRKAYLEEICIEWLRKYLGYGRESLQRKVPPEVKVTHKAIHDGLETLLCRAHAFYPQVIDATWRRDGEVRQGDTFRGVVSPNADGTYYTWLSINIDPQERSRFRCHVEHDGLGKPLDVAVEEAVPVWLVAVGVVLLGVLLVLAVAGVFLYLSASSSSSHTARYFLTVLSEPGQGLPRFTVVAYIDDQLIGYYDGERRKIVSPVPWVQKVEKEDPQLWDMHTQKARNEELYLGWHLADMQKLHNQSGGLHTWQSMSGCELHPDGRRRGHSQYAYDGRDFLAFDKDTLTWTAANTKAQVTKRSWDGNLSIRHSTKVYLEEICIHWLLKYLEYGKDTLLRKVPPEVTVTRKDGHDGLETLLCRAHGFYPREIDATWRRDGEARQGDTFRGVVSPNADGTYYTWLSIEVDPQERSRFRCHVEHDGLQEPLDVAVEEAVSGPVWLIAVGTVLGVLVAVLLVAAIVVLLKKRAEKAAYEATSTSDLGSDSSSRA